MNNIGRFVMGYVARWTIKRNIVRFNQLHLAINGQE